MSTKKKAKKTTRRSARRKTPAAKPKQDELRAIDHLPVSIADPRMLTPHPNNYRNHPDDQLDHIIHSIEEHGLYRNIVVARDDTILAGHGVVKAVLKMGLATVPVIKLPIDPMSPPALRLLAGDNEIGKLAEIDDRVLTDLLKELKAGAGDGGNGLMGTGFTEQMLSALVFVTRDANEVQSYDAAQEWVGLPEYTAQGAETYKLVVSFRNKEDRTRFCNEHKIELMTAGGVAAWSAWWPAKKRDEPNAAAFVEGQT